MNKKNIFKIKSVKNSKFSNKNVKFNMLIVLVWNLC